MLICDFKRPSFKPWAGSSNFPTSVDNKTALTDGVDYIEADNVNNAYVPLNKTQTFIGASGAAQSNNIDILDMLRVLNPTIKLSYVDADTIQASAGRIYCTNSGATIRVLRKNNSTTNITFSDLDTGARATSTRYYIWSNADAAATTVTYKISTSASAPTGVSVYALVGGFSTNATGSGEIISSTVWSAGGMLPIQQKHVSYVTFTTVTGAIPLDDSIPQNTEGGEIFTLTIIPKATTNRLLITVFLSGCHSTTGATMTVALFQDSIANALKCGANSDGGNNNSITTVSFQHEMEAATTSPITFKVRAGANTGDAYVNGRAAARVFGGVLASGMTIEEFEA